MLDALKAETNRGQACVADALLDELMKELFTARFVDDQDSVEEILAFGRTLGSHGARLKVAYLLGWIGQDTYQDCQRIHKIRNRMAHDLDVGSFDHDKVRDLCDGMRVLEDIRVLVDGEEKRLKLTVREDRFLTSVVMTVQRIWCSISDSKQASAGIDPPMVRLPNAQDVTSPRKTTAGETRGE